MDDPHQSYLFQKSIKSAVDLFSRHGMANINGYVVMGKSQNYFIGLVYCWAQRRLWSAEGFDDLKSLFRALVRHASSEDHLHAHLSLNNLSNQVFKITELLNEHSRRQKIKYRGS